MFRSIQLGRLVVYHELSKRSYSEMPSDRPLMLAKVVEIKSWSHSYLVHTLGLNTEPFTISKEQVVFDGYMTPWPPPDQDRKQVLEGVGNRLEVLGKECSVLAEKLRWLGQ